MWQLRNELPDLPQRMEVVLKYIFFKILTNVGLGGQNVRVWRDPSTKL